MSGQRDLENSLAHANLETGKVELQPIEALHLLRLLVILDRYRDLARAADALRDDYTTFFDTAAARAYDSARAAVEKLDRGTKE